MLIKLNLADDPKKETWINPLAVASIVRDTDTGVMTINMLNGANFDARGDGSAPDIIQEISRAELPQREL